MTTPTDLPNGYEALGKAVYDAWHDEGISPDHHRRMQEHLRQTWPVLYRAIVNNSPVQMVKR